MIKDVITVLAIQGWQKILEHDSSVDCPSTSTDAQENEDPLNAIDRLTEHFRIPLESANVEVSEIHEEFEGMITYAAQFISLSTMDYQSVWW